MKAPNFSKSLVEGTPIPGSGMTRIAMAKDWSLRSDSDPDPWRVDITFPQSWLQNPPVLAAGEGTVEPGVPTRPLLDDNRCKDSKYVTVSFPTRHFTGLSPEPRSQPDLAVDEVDGSVSREDTMECHERRRYKNAPGMDDSTGACGHVSPYDWENDDNETFFTDHESESTGDGGAADFIEIISQLETSEGDTPVWICCKMDNQHVFDLDCNVLVNVGDQLYYEYYVDYDPDQGKCYIMYWLEHDGDWYWDCRYDEAAPGQYERFIGSAELDSKGSLEERIS